MILWLRGLAAVSLLAAITAWGAAQESARRSEHPELAVARAKLALAEKELERVKELFVKGAAAAKELEQATANAARARAELDKLQAILARDDKGAALEMKGYVVPSRLVQASPRVAGQLVEVLVKEGDRVEKGQVLGRIDEAPFKAEVERVQAGWHRLRAVLDELTAGPAPEEVKKAEAAAKEAQAALDEARTRLDRIERLADSRAVSKEEVMMARMAVVAAEARAESVKAVLAHIKAGPARTRVEAAKAACKEAEAQLQRARWELDGTIFHAPISGTILVVKAEVGTNVSPSGPSLCDLADLTQLEVEVWVPERDLSRVTVGQACLLRVDAFPRDEHKGKVARIYPIADRSRGAVQVRIQIEGLGKESLLRPELTAIVKFLEK